LSHFNEEMSQVDESAIQTALSKITDPELGRPITDLKLVDRMDVSGGSVDLEFHLTAPFCPPVFALKIASDIKAGLLSVPGVTDAKVTLRGHYLADAVNKQVNKPTPPGT
jgi:ATP-binding protein involved in chromosome partitioning